MKVLFICTAYNSLSQRLALELAERGGHEITVEYALSPDVMVEAVRLAQPDLVLCPFLTKRIPAEIYTACMTLIVHPGPPGDEGPSALDWCIIGDTGQRADPVLPSCINAPTTPVTRSHWGVTVLQAVEAFDAGPVWAFDQFDMSGDNAAMTKSELYRGPVTHCALTSVLAALHRVQLAHHDNATNTTISPTLACDGVYRQLCVSHNKPFAGGKTHNRPLLKAAARDIVDLVAPFCAKLVPTRVSADLVVQRIRSADSQPGVLSTVFGQDYPLFLYNASVERGALPEHVRARGDRLGALMATRQGAVLVYVGADAPVWIGLLRRPKGKADKYLHPKLPAVMALLEVPDLAHRLTLGNSGPVPEWPLTTTDAANPWARQPDTYQQVWIELEEQIAYVYTEFYNGAFSTTQCQLLLKALQWIQAQPTVKAVVMMGGSAYFSNGIALNVIEGSADSAAEGWANINAIDDCVQALLAPAGVVTFAALRGNAAAGGLALATAADFVLCADNVVLNPHYRALGLYGSEWHTYSWHERCGEDITQEFVHSMLPMSAAHAASIGLVDHIVPNTGSAAQLVDRIKDFVRGVMQARADSEGVQYGAPWTKPLTPNDTLKTADMHWSAVLSNKQRYLANLFNLTAPTHEQLGAHLAAYRQRELSQMQLDLFHPHRSRRFALRCTAFVRKLVPGSTPLRFATHRRLVPGTLPDEEEQDAFDELAGIPASEAVPRWPARRPEFLSPDTQHQKHGSESSASSQTLEAGAKTNPSTAPTSPAATAGNTHADQTDSKNQHVEDDNKPKDGKVRRFLKSLRRQGRQRVAEPPKPSEPPAPASTAGEGECLFSCYYNNPDTAQQ